MPNLSDAFFLDCGKTYSGSPITAFTGLEHLEGATVKVMADGKVHPDCVVSDGAIILNYAASVVHVGLGYQSKMKTLPIVAGIQDGSTAGRLALVPEAILLVNESVGCKIGPDEDNLDEVLFVDGETFADCETLFSGAVDINIESGHDRQPRVVIVHDEATPLTISAINFNFEPTQ